MLKCDICGLETSNQKGMRLHMRGRHGIVPQTKVCSKCRVEKSLSEYHASRKTKDGLGDVLMGACKNCVRMDTRSKHCVEKPIKTRHWIVAYYGVSLEEYDKIYARRMQEQDGLCAICRRDFVALGLDHCHLTKQLRGLLCKPCNTGIGQFEDDVERLQSAIDYLQLYIRLSAGS